MIAAAPITDTVKERASRAARRRVRAATDDRHDRGRDHCGRPRRRRRFARPRRLREALAAATDAELVRGATDDAHAGRAGGGRRVADPTERRASTNLKVDDRSARPRASAESCSWPSERSGLGRRALVRGAAVAAAAAERQAGGLARLVAAGARGAGGCRAGAGGRGCRCRRGRSRSRLSDELLHRAPTTRRTSPSAAATPMFAAAGIVVTEISTPTSAPDLAVVSESTPAMPARKATMKREDVGVAR